MASTKLGRGKPICGQTKEVIINVYNYLKTVREKQDEFNSIQIKKEMLLSKEVAVATGLSENNVENIMTNFHRDGKERAIYSPLRMDESIDNYDDTSGEFYCAKCDVSFKTRHNMMTHMKKSIKHINPDLLVFACAHCPKKFEMESQRKLHIERYHLRNVRLACNLCPASFVSKQGLRDHRLRTHEGFKPALSHVCETCGRAFSTKVLIINHLRTHTGERPFKCETCARCFTQKASLQTHIRLVHLKLKRKKKEEDSGET